MLFGVFVNQVQINTVSQLTSAGELEIKGISVVTCSGLGTSWY